MAHYTAVVETAADPQTVFEYLADFASVAEWDPGVVTAELVSGTAGQAGARYRVVVSNGGVRTGLDYDVLSSRPPADGPGEVVLEARTRVFTSHDVITVTPTETGCTVVYDADLALNSVLRVFDLGLRASFQVIGRRADRGLRDALAGLADKAAR